MPQIGEIRVHVNGDIGNVGTSVYRFIRQDAASISGTNVTAIAVAAMGLYTAAKAYIPVNISITCDPVCNVYDAATGLVQGPLAVTGIPAAVTGSASGNYAAGTGARINWKTSTLAGRRLIKGCTYIVPMGTAGFAANGGVSAGAGGAITSAAQAYLTAVTAATCYPVVWHRPLKGVASGGVAGIVFAGSVPGQPAGLRSRRR